MTVPEDAEFDALAKDLTVRTGVSLAAYKPKCLRRRIAVRMRACGVHTYDEYRGVLANTPDEVERLHDALTINVTRFFRNPETWEAVKANVLPGLLAKNAPVRAWSAGCSSGEEAHTLAMLWADAAERAGHPGVARPLQRGSDGHRPRVHAAGACGAVSHRRVRGDAAAAGGALDAAGGRRAASSMRGSARAIQRVDARPDARSRCRCGGSTSWSAATS